MYLHQLSFHALPPAGGNALIRLKNHKKYFEVYFEREGLDLTCNGQIHLVLLIRVALAWNYFGEKMNFFYKLFLHGGSY